MVILLAVFLSSSLVASNSPAGAVDIYESDQTWVGDTVVSASQRLVFRDCALTIVDGNITVYGSLTLENVRITVQSSSSSNNLTVSGQGRLALSNTTVVSGPPAYYVYSMEQSRVTVNGSCSDYQRDNLALIAMGNSEVEILSSCLRSIECRDSSKVAVNDSTVGSISPMPIEEVSLSCYEDSVITSCSSIYRGAIVVSGNSEVSITSSDVKNIECWNSSKAKMAASVLGRASVHDNSTLFLDGIGALGMMTDVDAYSNSFSLGPHLHIYNCSLGTVSVWGNGRSELNVAHSTINDVQTSGYVELTYDNMTVMGEWVHKGEMAWRRRDFDHIGNFCIEWGDTDASGVIVSGTAGKIEKKDTIFQTQPAPIPQPLSGVYTFVYLSYRGEFTAQIRIHYADEQVASIDPSTLRLYCYTSDKGWQQLNVTGMNETGKYVWGNITHKGGLFSACFAALGSPKSNGAPPTLAGGMDWWALAPYIVTAVIVIVTAAGAVVYYRWVKAKR
ncbi:MAG: hypothetical protein ACQXXL_04185 [Candidatus Methanosuratincola sp.]|nr:hypothetical protein [Candidatus Methanosuratincola sp.]